MPDVIKVVLQLLHRVGFAVAIGIIHLRPAADSRFHQMTEMIKRDLLFVTLRTARPFRPRPDQTHLAPENVPELRQFIQTQSANPTTNAQKTRIATARVNLLGFFRSEEHTSE